VAGHGRAAEAEKDCSGDYAECFHWESPNLPASPQDVACKLKVCGPTAGTIEFQFRKLNSILMRAVDRRNDARVWDKVSSGAKNDRLKFGRVALPRP
jgi:hypothetical protein